MIKFGLKIKTRGGMVVDGTPLATLRGLLSDCDAQGVVVEFVLFAQESWRESIRISPEAERKVGQVYHRCEIIECIEVRPMLKEEGFDLESAINLIGKEGGSEPPGKT